MAQTTSLVFNGGVIPSPSPAPSGNGKAKLLKIGEITVTEQEVQVAKNVICDPDSVTTVAPFMEVLTSARLAELISANTVLVLDDGTMQYLISDATVAVEDGTSVCTAVNFLGLSKENRAKVLYPCTRLTDELTLQQVIEVGEPVETGFDLVKAYPEDTEAGTLIDKLEVVDNVRDPEDPQDVPLLSLETTVDGQGNRKAGINEDNLQHRFRNLANTVSDVIDTLDSMDFDEVPHGSFGSSLNQSPGDGTSTSIQVSIFRPIEATVGDAISWTKTTEIGGEDFGTVTLEPGTYIICSDITCQWVGVPRGTYLPQVGNVLGEPFDFSQQQEVHRRMTNVVTVSSTTQFKMRINFDATTPVMGFWINSAQIVKIAGGMSQTNVVHDSTLTGKGSVAEPLGVTTDVFGKAKDIPTSISQFRNGDVIPVDGPNGPAKMNKDDLIKETAQNTLDSLHALPDKNDGYLALNDANGTGKFDINTIFNNLAPAFVPNETQTKTGFPYVYGGGVYVAKEDYQGDWDATKFTRVPLSGISMLFRRSAPSGLSSLSSLVSPGFWGVSNTVIANVNDAPSGISGNCSLSVIPSVFPYVVQILTNATGNNFYKRSVDSTNNSASPWISGSLNEYVFRGQVNAELGYTTLKQCRKPGFYGETTAGVANITDLPSDYNTTQFFNLCVYPTNGILNLQILQSRDMKTWRRLSPAAGQSTPETAWVRDFDASNIFFQSVYSTLGYTKLSDCVEYGFYGSKSADISHIADLPADFISSKFFSLVVMPGNYDYYNLQLLCDRDGRLWERLSHKKGGMQAATAWRRIDCDGLYKGKVYADLGYTTLKQCRAPGFYGSDTSDISHITDLPSGYDSAQFFELAVYPINGILNMQVLMSRDMKTWKRFSPAAGQSTPETAWVYIGGPVENSTTRYIALGDSITEGWWSDDNGDYHSPSPGVNWPTYVGMIKGYDTTNAGVGGSGYVRRVAGTGVNCVDIVDDIDFSNYDLVTIAYGINDWKYVEDLGDMSTSTLNDGTMVGNMRYCIEKILTDNPFIKLVIIGPFNCTAMGGNVAGNWGLGKVLSNGTLQDCIDKIKSVCDYYNLQYIDCISSNISSRVTVPSIFKDGVHPKQDCILKMAKCFAAQIDFS